MFNTYVFLTVTSSNYLTKLGKITNYENYFVVDNYYNHINI